MGKSDKPVDAKKHSLAEHADSLRALVAHLKLEHGERITLVIHDWGSVVGQTALPLLDGSLRRLVVMNATGQGPNFFDATGWGAFVGWQGLIRIMGRAIPVGETVAGVACGDEPLTAGEVRGYDAPFPDADYKALPANWPLFYQNFFGTWETYKTALRWAKENLKVPIMVAFSTRDPTANDKRAVKIYKTWKRVASVQRVVVPNVGHFLQDGNPEMVTKVISSFISTGTVDGAFDD